MPWKETCAMDERLRFIAAHLQGEYSVSELCRHFGISRPTAYKWVERYEHCGPEGFLERSRAPKHHPNETPAALQYKLIALRQRHPRWGPRKLLALLRKAQPAVSWPAVSTAGDILKRHGLTPARRYRRYTPSDDRPLDVAARPNDVWAADFKGWFRTGDGCRVDPLTISDWVSRYLLGCQGLERPVLEQVQPQFERAFREYGLPWAIRTDNGPPFASTGLSGLSRLSVWWIRLGIKPERIRPAHPEDNGRHERMHKTLKESVLRPPQATLGSQQKAFDRFRHEYNELRPHEALGMQTPTECYCKSNRAFPTRLPELDYGPECDIRRVRSNGQIKWRGEKIFLSGSLIGELVGLKKIDNDVWSIHFGPVTVGTYHDFTRSIQPWGHYDPTKKV